MSVQDVSLRDQFGGKVTGNANQTTLVDVADATTTYFGKAQVGSKESEASWQIKRILKSGSLTKIAYAGGNDRYENIWDSRATYTYPTT